MSAMTVGYAVTGQRTLCGAVRKQADARCQRPAGWGTDHAGVGACKLHAGSTPNGRKHALRLITALVPTAVAELQRLLSDPETPDAVKLRTAQDILDRAGFAARQTVDLTGDVTLTVDDRRAALLDRMEALMSGTVIETTLADEPAE